MVISACAAQRRRRRRRGGVAARSCWSPQQRSQPNQVVGGGGERHVPVREGAAAMAQLAETADCLHPAKDLLDEVPAALADAIALVARRTAVDRAVLRLAGDVRRDAPRPYGGHEAGDIKELVRCDGGR